MHEQSPDTATAEATGASLTEATPLQQAAVLLDRARAAATAADDPAAELLDRIESIGQFLADSQKARELALAVRTELLVTGRARGIRATEMAKAAGTTRIRIYEILQRADLE